MTPKTDLNRFLPAILGMMLFGGCNPGEPPDTATDAGNTFSDTGQGDEDSAISSTVFGAINEKSAVADIAATEGNAATGRLHFAVVDGQTTIRGEISGLAPGLHGFHVHEIGDCSAADATSAGGHFSPDQAAPHGAPGDPDGKRHAGDLGNVEADADGIAVVNIQAPAITLDGGPNSVVGRAVIVHAQGDDLQSQPSGAAGPRVGCGVVTTTP